MSTPRIPFKNISHEVQLTGRRAWAALIVMVVLACLLICRLAYLQIYRNQLYTTLSTNNSMDLIPLEPTRGLIFDRHGILLADNIAIFSLDVIPEKTKNLNSMLDKISKIIPLSTAELALFNKQLKQHRRFEEISLKLRLSEKDLAHFAENQHCFPGFSIKAHLIRHYPFNSSFSHVLGYVGQINNDDLTKIDAANYSASRYIGKLGIEKYFEEELHGKVGYQEVEVDANGHPVRILKQTNPVPGKNLFLSIDSHLQLAAEKAFAGHRGALVAIQPSSGQILALVSLPSYDPNPFVIGISPIDFETLQKLPDHPLYNRAVRGLYPFASTIKPYLALAGLENKVITAEDRVYDPGWFMLQNSQHVFRDMHVHGSVNLNKAIATSCDVYFYQLANKLGIKRMDDFLYRFGFGETTGAEMDEEVAGVVSSPEWKQRVKKTPWYPGDTIISGIGQGYMQATPLQLAAAVTILANRGKHFVPSLLLGQQQPNKAFEPQAPLLINTLSLQNNSHWETIIAAMQNVIDAPEGTAHRFGAHHFYSIAGKTGTAQVHAKKEDIEGIENQQNLIERFRDHGLFIAFAPVDKPEIALAIIVEHDRSAAVPIAKEVLDYYFSHLSSQEQTHEQA